DCTVELFTEMLGKYTSGDVDRSASGVAAHQFDGFFGILAGECGRAECGEQSRQNDMLFHVFSVNICVDVLKADVRCLVVNYFPVPAGQPSGSRSSRPSPSVQAEIFQ